eukprot:scaffold112120_cov15-Tisochrysis_lutea.AAC.1
MAPWHTHVQGDVCCICTNEHHTLWQASSAVSIEKPPSWRHRQDGYHLQASLCVNPSTRPFSSVLKQRLKGKKLGAARCGCCSHLQGACKASSGEPQDSGLEMQECTSDLLKTEATKRKAAVVKQHYTGPLVKLVSKRRLKEVQPGQEDPAPTPAAPVAPGQPSAPTPAPAPPHTPGGPTPQTPAPAPPQSTPGAQPANGPTSAAPASGPSPPRETPGAGGGAAG